MSNIISRREVQRNNLKAIGRQAHQLIASGMDIASVLDLLPVSRATLYRAMRAAADGHEPTPRPESQPAKRPIRVHITQDQINALLGEASTASQSHDVPDVFGLLD